MNGDKPFRYALIGLIIVGPIVLMTSAFIVKIFEVMLVW